MLRTSHGTPRARAGAGKAAPPAARSTKAAPARTARPATARTTAAARGESARRGEDDGSRLKKVKTPVGTSTASDESREIAIAIAAAAIDKKASGLEVIDVAGRVDYADFLVLMSGRSDRHVAALSAAIEDALRKRNKRALAVEGLPHANWVLMDFGDVVVHVFQDDARATYDIDSLWMDARRIPVPAAEETR
ncbi:Iojap protein [Labilithrix luteola]|uniref:Ribosomal silencing factor RsfS n=2 Tax=Labilithrix luteola TaxID=1391654 RepID=A0A0K1QBI5_9BACT|nr:Iojap protein [Labilithrix luteola]